MYQLNPHTENAEQANACEYVQDQLAPRSIIHPLEK